MGSQRIVLQGNSPLRFPGKSRTDAYMQTIDDRYGRDWGLDGAHALVEGILGFIRADNCPRGTVVDHLLVRLLRTGRRLK